MSKNKPFADPTHTQFSNDALDRIMPLVSGAVWKLICAIVRKTKGYHKEEDELSYSQLEAMTGMTRPTVSKAVQDALEAGYILRRQVGPSFKYRLNKDYELPDSKEIELVKKSNQTSKETLPKLVKKLNTQKKERKLKESIAPMAQTTQDDIRKRAEDYFRKKTGLKPLPGNTARIKKQNGTRWYAPLRTICEMGEWEPEKIQMIMDECFKILEPSMIFAPQSLVNSLSKAQANLNGHLKNRPQYVEVYE